MMMLLILFTSFLSWANPDVKNDESIERRWELTPLADIMDLKETDPLLFNETVKHKNELKKVKFYLLNGELRLARLHLTKLSYTQSRLRPIIYRYLGILHFIEGEYEKSYEFLSKPELKNLGQFAKICTLKVINEIILDKNLKLEDDWRKCQIENSANIEASNLAWLSTLVEMKLNPSRGITQVPFKSMGLRSLDNKELKIILKLALYLNQEELLEKQLNDLTEDHIRDPEIREIVGHIYFRLGSPKKAYRFVEDLRSPNAESMKGNLYIWRKKYELAYAQFKLALDQKANSQNAIERLLPLAWILGDWKSGGEYAERVVATSANQMNKLTLVAAFLTQQSEFKKASKVLDIISQTSRMGTQIDVTQLYSFVGLMDNKPDLTKKHAAQSCDQYDLVNCWLQLQMIQWEVFPVTIKRDEKIIRRKEWEKLTQESGVTPFKETVFVNQLDIEELDDKSIQLIP